MTRARASAGPGPGRGAPRDRGAGGSRFLRGAGSPGTGASVVCIQHNRGVDAVRTHRTPAGRQQADRCAAAMAHALAARPSGLTVMELSVRTGERESVVRAVLACRCPAHGGRFVAGPRQRATVAAILWRLAGAAAEEKT
jgi:hypothetical protein